MRIVICASVDVTPKTKEISETLIKMGHTVDIPHYSKKIIDGEISFEDYLRIKGKDGDTAFREQAGTDLIKRHYNLIQNADAILVVNVAKKGVENYIGGNTFLELGFAHILNKKIFLLNPIPAVNYKDEIVAMNPTVVNNDLTKII